ncbi:hypothetical protein OG21DRAFT_1492314 [Imleria badia]|nr:hypothetical protein OG21DRAFT_1492314 [Imleria badia]
MTRLTQQRDNHDATQGRCVLALITSFIHLVTLPLPSALPLPHPQDNNTRTMCPHFPGPHPRPQDNDTPTPQAWSSRQQRHDNRVAPSLLPSLAFTLVLRTMTRPLLGPQDGDDKTTVLCPRPRPPWLSPLSSGR